MTLHWIENNQVQEAAMAFSVLPPISKTATVVSRYLIDNFKKVDAYTAGGLRRIIFTTDQGSNILSAFKDSGFVVAIEDIDIRPEILQSTRISCSSHILNNVLTKLFKPSELKIHCLSLRDLLHNCYQVVTFVKSGNVNAKLGRTLKKYVATRWNSHLALIKGVLLMYHELLIHLRGTNKMVAIEAIDRNQLEVLVKFLKVFKAASDDLEGSTYPTIYMPILLNFSMQDYFKSFSSSFAQIPLNITPESDNPESYVIDDETDLANTLPVENFLRWVNDSDFETQYDSQVFTQDYENQRDIITYLSSFATDILSDKFKINHIHCIGLFLIPFCKSFKVLGQSASAKLIETKENLRRLIQYCNFEKTNSSPTNSPPQKKQHSSTKPFSNHILASLSSFIDSTAPVENN